MNKAGLFKQILFGCIFSLMLIAAINVKAYADTSVSSVAEIEMSDKTETVDEVTPADEVLEADGVKASLINEESSSNEAASETVQADDIGVVTSNSEELQESETYKVTIEAKGIKTLKYIIAMPSQSNVSEKDIKSIQVVYERAIIEEIPKGANLYFVGFEGINGRGGTKTVYNSNGDAVESKNIGINNDIASYLVVEQISADISNNVKVDYVEYKKLVFVSNKAYSVKYNCVKNDETIYENQQAFSSDGKIVIDDVVPGSNIVITAILGAGDREGSKVVGAVKYNDKDIEYTEEKGFVLGPINSDSLSGSEINFIESYTITLATKNVGFLSYVTTKNLSQTDKRDIKNNNIESNGSIKIENIPAGYYVVVTSITPIDAKLPYQNISVCLNNKAEQSKWNENLGVYTIDENGRTTREVMSGYSLGKVDYNSYKANTEYTISCEFQSMLINDNLTNGKDNSQICVMEDKKGFDKVISNGKYLHYTKSSNDKAEEFAVEVKAKNSDFKIKNVYARLFYIDENQTKQYLGEKATLVNEAGRDDKDLEKRKNYYYLDSDSILGFAETFYNEGVILKYTPQIDIISEVVYKDRTISFSYKYVDDLYVSNSGTSNAPEKAVKLYSCDSEGNYDAQKDEMNDSLSVPDYSSGEEDTPRYFKAVVNDEHYELASITCAGNAVFEPIYSEDNSTGEVDFYKLTKVHSDLTIAVNASVKTTEDDAATITIDNKVKNRALFSSSDLKMTSDTTKWSVPKGSKQVTFTVTEAATHVPIVSFGEKELKYIALAEKSNNKIEYTYRLYAVDITTGSTITIKDIEDTRTVYIKYMPTQVYTPSVTNEEGVEFEYDDEELEKSGKKIIVIPAQGSESDVASDGFVVLKYTVPYTSTITVTTKAYDDCKLIGATYKKTPVKFNRTGSYSFKVNKDMAEDDFIINSSATRTLVVTNTKGNKTAEVPGVNKTWNVLKNDQEYCAFIKEGISQIKSENNDCIDIDRSMKLSKRTDANTTYEYEVIAKAGTSDVTNRVINTIDDDGKIHFSFIDPQVAGKTVNVVINEIVTTKNANRDTVRKNVVSNFRFVVSPYVSRASISGEINNVISHELFVKKNYRLIISPIIPYDYIKVVPQYYNNIESDWTDLPSDNKFIEFSKGTISVDASMDNLKDIITAQKGVPKFRVRIYDVTVPGYTDSKSETGVVATKNITLTMKSLAAYLPAVSVRCTSDTDITLNLATPYMYSAYSKYLRYDISAAAIDDSYKDSMKKEAEDNEVELDSASHTLSVSDSGPGNGHAKKYNVSSRVIFYLPGDKDGEIAKDEQEKPIELFSSRERIIRNVSTKEPAYEKRLSAYNRTYGLYAGQENVRIATTIFSRTTTYYELAWALYNASGDKVQASFEVNDRTDVYLIESASLQAGRYTLKLWPKDEQYQTEAKAAKVIFTIYEPIREDDLSASVPSTRMYKKPYSSNVMKVTPCYSNKPKTKRVTYSIEPVDGIGDANDNIKNKYVTVNAAGYIILDRRYVIDTKDEKNNTFKVVIKAADYKENTASRSVVMTVNKNPVVIQDITLKERGTNNSVQDNKVFVGGKYNFDYTVTGDCKDSCVYTVSPAYVAELNYDEPSKPYIAIKRKGNFYITCTAKDGGNSVKRVTYKAVVDTN